MSESSTLELANPPSEVFVGEQASNQEMQVQRLASMGLNVFRVSFESQCTTWREGGPYNSTGLERSFRIAEHFNFWIIVDYHGFNDTATSSTIDCWLGFWSGLVEQFKARYYQTVWEPMNEPTGFGFNRVAVAILSVIYQRWINQTRGLGDTNWIVVQNLCSFRCDFDNKGDGYPTVSDPLGKVLISIHPYMGYKQYWQTWDNQTADARAQKFYNAMRNGTLNTGWPLLNTEGGTGGTFNGTHRCPDLVATGSAGYCRTNFHFIQTLTNLLDSNPGQRINWAWWTISGGTDTPGAGVYGALSSWGGILRYRILLLADVNNDCKVNIVDAAKLANAYGAKFGENGYFPGGDLNNDGAINLVDLAILATSYGQTCQYGG